LEPWNNLVPSYRLLLSSYKHPKTEPSQLPTSGQARTVHRLVLYPAVCINPRLITPICSDVCTRRCLRSFLGADSSAPPRQADIRLIAYCYTPPPPQNHLAESGTQVCVIRFPIGRDPSCPPQLSHPTSKPPHPIIRQRGPQILSPWLRFAGPTGRVSTEMATATTRPTPCARVHLSCLICTVQPASQPSTTR
jgi:hypothetical protein